MAPVVYGRATRLDERPPERPRQSFVIPLLGALLVALVAGFLAFPARAEEPLVVPPLDTPTPAPTYTPVDTPEPRAQPSSRGRRDWVEEMAAEVFGPDLAAYVSRIAYCESRHDPNAVSQGYDRSYGVYFRHVGLMQIEQNVWGPVARRLFGSDDLTDPWLNLSVARVIQREQGWRAWPVCSGFRGGW